MSDDDFDDLDLTDDPESDEHVRLSKADVKRLRQAARRAGVAERELSDLRREKKVRDAGLNGLSPRQIATLAREVGDDDGPEKLREIAVEFGWASPPEPSAEQQQTDAEVNAHTQVAAIANGAEPPAQRSSVKPEDINSWPVDKQMRLNELHPDLAESVLRGEPIDLPPGF